MRLIILIITASLFNYILTLHFLCYSLHERSWNPISTFFSKAFKNSLEFVWDTPFQSSKVKLPRTKKFARWAFDEHSTSKKNCSVARWCSMVVRWLLSRLARPLLDKCSVPNLSACSHYWWQEQSPKAQNTCFFNVISVKNHKSWRQREFSFGTLKCLVGLVV